MTVNIITFLAVVFLLIQIYTDIIAIDRLDKETVNVLQRIKCYYVKLNSTLEKDVNNEMDNLN